MLAFNASTSKASPPSPKAQTLPPPLPRTMPQLSRPPSPPQRLRRRSTRRRQVGRQVGRALTLASKATPQGYPLQRLPPRRFHLCVCARVFVCVDVDVWMCMCGCGCAVRFCLIYVYLIIFICIYIYIYDHLHIGRDSAYARAGFVGEKTFGRVSPVRGPENGLFQTHNHRRHSTGAHTYIVAHSERYSLHRCSF